MKKPESSTKRRRATVKRALKRNKRNTNAFKKTVIKRLNVRKMAKIIANRKFQEHMDSLMGK